MKQAASEHSLTLPSWTFLSNHAHVLLLIARDPDVKLREVALRVGITERAVQRIVADLEAANYLERTRTGRRNHYRVHSELPLRHPIEAHTEVGALLDLILKTARVAEPRASSAGISPSSRAAPRHSASHSIPATNRPKAPAPIAGVSVTAPG